MARGKKKSQTKPEPAQAPVAAEPPTRRNRRGRPEFEPSADQRSIVETAIGYGLTQDQVCELVLWNGAKISVDTLRKYFPAEISRGEVHCHFEAAVSLRTLIRGRPARYDSEGRQLTAEIPITPSAVYFYHKTRRGWHERVELTGANGGPIETTNVKSELARRIARHASPPEPESAGEDHRVLN